MREWPLVIFTVAIQSACGLALAATLFDVKARHDAALMRPLALAIFPLAALGALASVAHLGRPLAAWRAVLNLRRSPLSMEVVLTGMFVALALAYSGFWWSGRSDGRLALGVVASLAGLAAVVSSALVYTVPAQPAWNSGWVPASFVGTALLLGGLAPAVFASAPAGPGALRVAGSALLLIAAVWIFALRQPRSAWLALCFFAAGLLPASLPAFIAVVLATIAGRALFYLLAGTF
jgi:anaerobic dimethyl sulfoxide reductase subunit C (anchor subunit)